MFFLRFMATLESKGRLNPLGEDQGYFYFLMVTTKNKIALAISLVGFAIIHLTQYFQYCKYYTNNILYSTMIVPF